jgi:hypothetical protein
MVKTLYDAVTDRLQYDETAEIEKAKRSIVFPELDTQRLEFEIAAALCNRANCVIVASNE